MNTLTKDILNAAWYVVVFVLLQIVITFGVGIGIGLAEGLNFGTVAEKLAHGTLSIGSTATIWTSAACSVLTIALFAWCRWTPLSPTYLQTRPWGVLIWVALFTLGTLIPSEWLQEQLAFDMPEAMKHLFSDIMSRPAGYLVIGILAPLAEEIVFRGAVLRTLLHLFHARYHWVAIALSAIVFGLVHGNAAQFVHACLMGLALGWLYYRTDSLLPGLVLHWVNNSVAFVACNLMPAATDAKLIDIFQGKEETVWMALGFSLCIMLPALFQLAVRLKKAR